MNPSQKETGGSLDRSIAAVVAGQATGTGRRGRKSAETRLRLFRCALKLFAERGFPSVTVEEITEAADVGKGTFFNYFQSKEHVLGVMAEIQLGKIRKAADMTQDRRMSVQAILRGLVHRLAEEPGRSPALARAFISSFLANESVRATIRHTMLEGRKTVAQVLAAGQANGEINSSLKREKLALLLLQTCIGTVLLWSLHEKPRLESWMEDSFQHYWRSIAAPGAKQEP